jgi:hypothetical protein
MEVSVHTKQDLEPRLVSVQSEMGEVKAAMVGWCRLTLRRPMLKPPGTKRLKLEFDESLSNSAFKFNCRYITAEDQFEHQTKITRLSQVGPPGTCRHYFWHDTQIEKCRLTPRISGIFEGISGIIVRFLEIPAVLWIHAVFFWHFSAFDL